MISIAFASAFKSKGTCAGVSFAIDVEVAFIGCTCDNLAGARSFGMGFCASFALKPGGGPEAPELCALVSVVIGRECCAMKMAIAGSW